MSGETAKAESGWSVDTLKEFLLALISETKATLMAADAAADVRNEQRFTAQQQAIKDALISQKEGVASALVAAEKAVLVAETNSEKWRGNANEWRGAMNDRERNLMPRTESEAATKGNADKIDALAARMDAGDKVNAEAIKQLTAALDKAAGRREGLMLIFAVIAAIATVIAFLRG